jgi:hypothetical protein
MLYGGTSCIVCFNAAAGHVHLIKPVIGDSNYAYCLYKNGYPYAMTVCSCQYSITAYSTTNNAIYGNSITGPAITAYSGGSVALSAVAVTSMAGCFVSPFPSIYASGGACILGCVWANAFCTISERETKCDLVLADTVLPAIRALPVYAYRYRDDKEKAWHLGIMADDFQKAVPWMGDGHGIPALGSFALAATKELDKCIDALNARLAALEARLSN